MKGVTVDRGRTFDSVASNYDAQRSGYPAALFADIMKLAQLRAGDRVLEVGCGSGQATAGFASAGLDVTAVDPGPHLIEIARTKFAGDDRVRFEASTFEDWRREGRKYQLVAAAQSWHWLRDDIRWAKAAEALAPKGSLAIFGHTPAWSAALRDCLEPIYARLAPELRGPPPEVWYLPDGPIAGLIEASGRFGRPEHRQYVWRRDYSAAAFAAYLGTRSDHVRLPAGRRNELLSAVQAALPKKVEADWKTNLYVAPGM
jgi:SAM-dependent methyltransferase